MQISGDDFLKKVQLKQEKNELEKKLNEIDETRISMSNINLSNNLNSAYNSSLNSEASDIDRLRNMQFDNNSNHEFDNLMLNQQVSQEDNKKKYLILGIVLVVLFLLTIIIIKLLTGDSKKDDPFTTNNQSSSSMKTLSENSNNIEDRYQRILEDRVKKDVAEPTPMQASTTDSKLDSIKEDTQVATNDIKADNENIISNETIDETIRKIEEKKAAPKTPKVTQEPKAETQSKKSIRDLVEGTSNTKASTSSSASGYFVQIGAFSKTPSQSYLNSISKEGFEYKVIQEDVKGTLYNKVLIGPYSSKTAAQRDMNSIKNRLNIKSAFVVSY